MADVPFFDPPTPTPPPRLPAGPPRPRWAEPPEGVLGELVVDRVEVVRTPDVHVAVEDVRAYPQGFELRLMVRSRAGPPPGASVVAWRNAMNVSGLPGQPPRLGLGFADGARLTNLTPALGVPDDAHGPLLVHLGVPDAPFPGPGPGDRYWVWGLPPPGDLTIAVEVPSLGVTEVTAALDADGVRSAAGRAQVLWGDEQPAPYRIWPGIPTVFVPEPQPMGAPPDDQDAARSAIERAFAGLLQVEGDEVVNVEGGTALGRSMRELQARVGSAAADAVHQVERITFVDASSAAVVFSVWSGPAPIVLGARGDAVLRDGRWLVARATFCGLLARVGVRCPP
jgi:hypothetical protein